MSDEEKEKMRQFLIANLKSICFYYLAKEEYDAMFTGLNMYCYLDNKDIFNQFFNQNGKDFVKKTADFYYDKWMLDEIFDRTSFNDLLKMTDIHLNNDAFLHEKYFKKIIENIILIIVHIYYNFDYKRFEKYVGRLEYGGQKSVSC